METAGGNVASVVPGIETVIVVVEERDTVVMPLSVPLPPPIPLGELALVLELAAAVAAVVSDEEDAGLAAASPNIPSATPGSSHCMLIPSCFGSGNAKHL